MKLPEQSILVVNGGSSSVKFALYHANEQLDKILKGEIKRIGTKNPVLTTVHLLTHERTEISVNANNFKEAAAVLIEWLSDQELVEKIVCIGHRIVYGMEHTQPEVIDDQLVTKLKKMTLFDPDHLPSEIAIIQLFKKKFPNVVHVACFDTAFHATMPKVAKTFAIPKKYYDDGVQRYGFHGISYSYLMEELKKKEEVDPKGKTILAHLGSGASLAAVKDGICLDTSMGFTPAGGVVMSTRSGDLDPGVIGYLMQQGLDAKAINDLINHQSGLLGISGLSSDMEVLLHEEKMNQNAALAVELFCYQIKKYIGAYTAVLGGLDTLVFSGGIGEHAAAIRARICKGFAYLGIEIDEEENKKNASLISTSNSEVTVYVLPTDEEIMIARETRKLYLKMLKKSN